MQIEILLLKRPYPLPKIMDDKKITRNFHELYKFSKNHTNNNRMAIFSTSKMEFYRERKTPENSL